MADPGDGAKLDVREECDPAPKPLTVEIRQGRGWSTKFQSGARRQEQLGAANLVTDKGRSRGQLSEQRQALQSP